MFFYVNSVLAENHKQSEFKTKSMSNLIEEIIDSDQNNTIAYNDLKNQYDTLNLNNQELLRKVSLKEKLIKEQDLNLRTLQTDLQAKCESNENTLNTLTAEKKIIKELKTEVSFSQCKIAGFLNTY